MSLFEEWSARLEDHLTQEKTRDDLLRRGSTDWTLATDYAFSLAAHHLGQQRVPVPMMTQGYVSAAILSGLAAVLGWAIYLNALSASTVNLTLCAVLSLAFQLKYGRMLGSLTIPDSLYNKVWLCVGLAFCAATAFVWPADFALRIGVTLIVVFTSLGALSCALTLVRPTMRFRFNLLEMTKDTRSGLENGQRFLFSISGVAACVYNLRKAQDDGPERFAHIRDLYGATPGQATHGSHPLSLTDRQFEQDLVYLLKGTLPPDETGATT